jgi:hypothetical protein
MNPKHTRFHQPIRNREVDTPAMWHHNGTTKLWVDNPNTGFRGWVELPGKSRSRALPLK